MTNGKPADLQQSRVNIIQTVQTPLGFFALVVLVVEVIFGITANFSQGSDRTYLIVGMIGLMFLLVCIVAFFAYKKPGALHSSAVENDIKEKNIKLSKLKEDNEKLIDENEEFKKITDSATVFPAKLDFGEGVLPDFPINRIGKWCVYVPGYKNAETKYRGEARLFFSSDEEKGIAIWIWYLPLEVKSNDSIYFEIDDDENNKWKIDQTIKIPDIDYITLKAKKIEVNNANKIQTLL